MTSEVPPANAALPSPYSVKRHGVTIANCDSEPVQTPGCIQPHGVLLALRPSDLSVAQVSENSQAWLGRAPEDLLGAPITAVLGEQDGERLRSFLASEALERNPLYAFTTTIAATGERLDLTAHYADGVALIELEQTGRTERDAPNPYALLKRASARLQAAATVAEFCQTIADEVFEVTGLDRVMVYRFASDGAGEVFAEAKRADLHPWRGLRYPADDIPAPARAIFKRIGVRPLPDARAEMMEMVPLANPDTGRPLDMTHCALRGASVMYTEYLQNMGVAASLTMPLLRQGELWGLIACQHQTPTRLPYTMRSAAELLAQVASLQLPFAEQREHTGYRARVDALHHELLTRAAQTSELTELLSGAPNLLDGIECDAVALRYRDCWTTLGPTPTQAQLDALASWLETSPEFRDGDRPVLATQALATRFPPAAAYAELASGLLAIPLARELNTMILWFRAEVIQTVSWAGNPHDKPTVPGPHGPRLTPRKSFEIWQEQARGRSCPWEPVELEAALALRYSVMDLIMSQAERLAELNIELARSNAELDAFAYVASHDLKEPLRGIHKYAHYLLEEAKSGAKLSEQGRERLANLLRLTVRMDGLLDALLHFSRVGRLELDYEDLAVDAIVREAVEMLGARLSEVDVELRIPRPLPWLRCDRVRVREVFANLISNAIKYNDKPHKWVEIGYIGPGEAPAEGETVFYVRDNGVGIGLEHHERVFAMFKRLHPRDGFGGGAGAGLTIAKKLVEQHRGQIWIESTPGEGSTFFFTLGCESS